MKKNHYRGKLIVFEGLDGAGTETQARLLRNYLIKQNKSVERLYYPDYKGPIGRLIHQYLQRQYEFSVNVQFLLHFADFAKDKEKINRWLESGKTVVCDRYFSSTLAYQGLRGFPVKRALALARDFGLPKPDLIIYLKVSPEISMSRKYKEKRKLDRNEADKKFLEKVGHFYEKLIKGRVFSKWAVVNGEQSIREVFFEVKKIIYGSIRFKE